MRPITKSFIASLESHRRLHAPSAVLYTPESIAFQKNDSFGPQLEAVVSKYKDLVDAGANQKAIRAAKELKVELEAVIFRRLGLSVSLITDGYLAATIPNVFIPHNPMIQDVAREFFEVWGKGAQDKLEKLKNNTIVGTVNTETATVSGWFSQQKAPLFVNFKALFSSYGLTVPQVVAVILHELGHDFNAVIFSANINTTNQIVADIARHITSSDRGGDVNYIYAKLKLIDRKASKDIAEALASGNRVVLSVGTFRLLNLITQSVMNNHVYDRTSFEATSDQFVSRFGYGAFLFQALEALQRDSSEYEQSKAAFAASAIALFMFGWLAWVYALVALFGPVLLKIPFGLLSYGFGKLCLIVLDANSVSGSDRTYDNLRDRYMRIRLQLVEMIKDPDIDRAAKTTLLEEIKLLDIAISQKKVFDNPITKMLLLVSSKDQRAEANIKLQRDIESLLANEMFVAANELQVKEST